MKTFGKRKTFARKTSTNTKTSTWSSGNTFVGELNKTQARTTSAKGATAYSSAGDVFVDDFGRLTQYITMAKSRNMGKNNGTLADFDTRMASMSQLMRKQWSTDRDMTVRMAALIRSCDKDRDVMGGAKNEGLLRWMWIAKESKRTFKGNFDNFIKIASWKDVFTMLYADALTDGKDILPTKFILKRIKSALASYDANRITEADLVMKYLPLAKSSGKINKIKSDSKRGEQIAKNIVSNMIAKHLGVDQKGLRAIKRKGNEGSHVLQTKLSVGEKIKVKDLENTGGKMLASLNKSETRSHGSNVTKALDKMSDKINSGKDVRVNVSNNIVELGLDILKASPSRRSSMTSIADAQASKLIGKLKGLDKLWICVDESGSMSWDDAFNPAKVIASALSLAPNNVIGANITMFDSQIRNVTLQGDSFSKRLMSFPKMNGGGTNFDNVVNYFTQNIVPMALNGLIAMEDMPLVMLVLTDGDFDRSDKIMSHYEKMINLLRSAGLPYDYVSRFKMVFWNLKPNGKVTYQSHKDSSVNVANVSGYDTSIINTITHTGNEHDRMVKVLTECYGEFKAY